MASGKHMTPPFRGAGRGGGDRFTPDHGRPGRSRGRGKYPKDAGGPPETKVGRFGPSGDASTPDVPRNAQIDRVAPRKPTASNTTTNPLR